MRLVQRVVLSMFCVLAATAAHAQVQTGSIAGIATDTSNAVMPGVSVSVSGDKLIGGVQIHRRRIPPGHIVSIACRRVHYNVKFELQGFKNIERNEIAISAAFVATVNAKLEVGSVSETITVTGESPTVDTRSNLQQTVMNQEVLEGIPPAAIPGRWPR